MVVHTILSLFSSDISGGWEFVINENKKVSGYPELILFIVFQQFILSLNEIVTQKERTCTTTSILKILVYLLLIKYKYHFKYKISRLGNITWLNDMVNLPYLTEILLLHKTYSWSYNALKN